MSAPNWELWSKERQCQYLQRESAIDVEIPCPNGCDPKTAPTPNPRFCPACNNTGWAKAGVMPEKSDGVEVKIIPPRITTMPPNEKAEP